MPGYAKGILVALANTVLIALFIALNIAEGDTFEATMIISMMGFIPAVLIGAMLGHYGETSQTSNRRVMLICMIAIGCAAVAFLGTIFDLPELILVSCVPTAAACSILERWTRSKRDEEVPIARVA